MTEATAEIGERASAQFGQRDDAAARGDRGPIYPLFTHGETERATDRWQSCPLRQPFTLDGERSRARVSDERHVSNFVDAGHVLGAAGILLRAEGRTIFYTGDVNFDDQTITQARSFRNRGSMC